MSEACPNSDPGFDQVLNSIIGNSSPELRRKLFYGVCIPVRFSLYLLVFYYRNFKFMPIIVGLVALATAIRLSPSIINPGKQWWSKRLQFFISSILVLVCAGVYLNKIDNRAMALTLFISLIVGVIQSLFITFC